MSTSKTEKVRDMPSVTVRLDPTTYRKLQKKAKKERRSSGACARVMLEESLESASL